MDGSDAFPDTKAGLGECGDELEFARLQHETGHENHRRSRFDEGAVGLKKANFGPSQSLQKIALTCTTSRLMRPATLTVLSLSKRTSMTLDDEAISLLHTLGPKLPVAKEKTSQQLP